MQHSFDFPPKQALGVVALIFPTVSPFLIALPFKLTLSKCEACFVIYRYAEKKNAKLARKVGA